MNSIQNTVTNEIVIQKSKFITTLYNICNVAEAKAALSIIKKEHSMANHNCYAYIIGNNMEYIKTSDDKEPSNTAGIPILEVLKRNNITNTLAVVTRYFGGIKLGIGGLTRAYSKSVSKALEKATVTSLQTIAKITLSVIYDLSGGVETYLRKNDYIDNIVYSNNILYYLSVPNELLDLFKQDINNITKGMNELKFIKKITVFK